MRAATRLAYWLCIAVGVCVSLLGRLRWPPKAFFVGCGLSSLILAMSGWDYFWAEIDRSAYRCNLPEDGSQVVGYYDAQSRNAVCIRVAGRNER